MKIASWNINGIRAIAGKGELDNFLDSVRPDILCLQEIKAKPEQIDWSHIGYRLITNSAQRAGYSGTGALIRDDVAIADQQLNLPVAVATEYKLSSDSFGDANSEGRVTTLDLGEFYLVTVYTPNAKADLSRLKLREFGWDPAFLAYTKELRAKKPVVFCGDLNVAAEEIDLANPKANIGKHGFTDEERAGFRRYIDDGFLDSFRYVHGNEPNQYTWWSHWAHARERNIGWRIDYFLVDQRLGNRLKGATIYQQQMGSDHCPISIDLEV